MIRRLAASEPRLRLLPHPARGNATGVLLLAALATAGCSDPAPSSSDWVLGVYHDRERLPQTFVSARSVINIFVHEDGSVVQRTRTCGATREQVAHGTWTPDGDDRVYVESEDSDAPLTGLGSTSAFEIVRASDCETVIVRIPGQSQSSASEYLFHRGEACARVLPPPDDADIAEYDSCELYECGDPSLTHRCFVDPPAP